MPQNPRSMVQGRHDHPTTHLVDRAHRELPAWLGRGLRDEGPRDVAQQDFVLWKRRGYHRRVTLVPPLLEFTVLDDQQRGAVTAANAAGCRSRRLADARSPAALA